MNEVIINIGAFGSGKSEFSANLAFYYKEKNYKVVLVDLDFVNPYFRTRRLREKFEEYSIEIIAPLKEYKYADVPMLSPKIAGAINNRDNLVILDVGGDIYGCKALARYVQILKERGYRMQFIINTKRPFTSNLQEITEMKNNLELASKLKIFEIICNTNLMEYTDNTIIEQGINLLEEFSQKEKIAFNKYLVMDKFSSSIKDKIHGKEKFILQYFLSKPWETKNYEYEV